MYVQPTDNQKTLKYNKWKKKMPYQKSFNCDDNDDNGDGGAVDDGGGS